LAVKREIVAYRYGMTMDQNLMADPDPFCNPKEIAGKLLRAKDGYVKSAVQPFRKLGQPKDVIGFP
jgi:hypothetical protein